jgi:hypothetical protein
MWHTFGDLERMVELGRDWQLEGKKLGREKRALRQLESVGAGTKRTRIDDGQHVRISSGNARVWEETLAEYKEKGYGHLDEFWEYYQLDEEMTCVGGAHDSSCISLRSFNTCMNFIGWLISGENIERVMGLVRAERLRSRTGISESTTGEDLTGWNDSPNMLLFGLVQVYRVQHQTQMAYTRRNLLMTKVAELSPSLNVSDMDTVLDPQHQETLRDLVPEEFGTWTQVHWHALSQNMSRWWTLTQHPKWRQSSSFGLGLLLPTSWKWNVDEHLAEVDMETWSWFVDRIHLICPNLHQLSCGLNDYGYAIMEHQILPALLKMEIQRTTNLNLLAADEVACRLSIEAEEAKRIARFYEHLARRPPDWQRTVELVQQHM